MALYPDYATLAELRAYVRITDAGDTAEDTHLTAAITAASRAIDQTTKRQFGLAASAVARVYTPYYHETHRRYALDIDDLMTTTSMVVKTDLNDDHTFENTITAYRLWPLNAAGDSRPWTSLVFDSTIPVVLDTGSVEQAVGRTADVVYSVLERTTALGRRELALVAAQDDLTAPRFRFDVRRIS